MSAYIRAIDIYDADAVEQLLKRIQRNPAHHEEEFFHAFWNDAYRLAFGVLGNTHDAEDVAQVALIQALAKLDTLKDPRAALKWIHRIVGNLALNYRRDEGRRITNDMCIDFDISEIESYLVLGTTSNPDTESMSATTSHHLPDELVERKEVNRIVYELIGNLPSKQRQAVMLYYYADFSVGEIAEDMDVSPNTVKAHLFQARETLNNRIKEIEEAQGISLYSAHALPLVQIVKEIAQHEFVPPAFSPQSPNGFSEPKRETKAQGDADAATSRNTVPKTMLTVGATVVILLLGTIGWTSLDRSIDEEPPAVSRLSVADTTSSSSKDEKQSSSETGASPQNEDAPLPSTTTRVEGSGNPSPTAPTQPPSSSEVSNSAPPIVEQPVPQPPAAPQPPPEPPPNNPQRPNVGSLVHFGTQNGQPVIWSVTEKTATTFTITALENVSSLGDILTSAQLAVLIPIREGVRPVVEIDASRVNLTFRDDYIFVEVP